MKTFQFILLFLIGFIAGAIAMHLDKENGIKHLTVFQGEDYYVDNNDTSSNIKFEWEGLDKDIPKDGIVTVQFNTNEDTVYINPVDE